MMKKIKKSLQGRLTNNRRRKSTLIAGKPLEPKVPKCNNLQDWVISSEDNSLKLYNGNIKIKGENYYNVQRLSKPRIYTEGSRVHSSEWKQVHLYKRRYDIV